MKKYHETLTSTLYDTYSYPNMRGSLSLAFLLYLIQYHSIKNILEIGFYEGQTLGLMLEATQPGSVLTAIDIDYSRDSLYQKYFHDSKYTKGKTVELVHQDSRTFTPSRKYDLVNVDGDNEARRENVRMAIECLSPNGILMIDNYSSLHNRKVINDFMKDQSEWQPFIIDSQAAYFKKEHVDLSNFLDNVVSPEFDKIAYTYNIIYHSYVVKELRHHKTPIYYYDYMFQKYCELKNV